ncbi:MAG: hypothetical protein BRD57_03735 [Proteobacteria bacterium SW_6_67_9]|nr:MAG: hypothetical protein BRD57_03735 [Proteobacteria bacterium SW_6_67_9]
MRRVYTGDNVFDAQLVSDRLNENGVTATIHGVMLIGGVGELPADTRPSVWIADDADYERARRLIEAFERDTAGGADWMCPHCDEHNGAAFEGCWACGEAPRGGR